MTTTGTSRPPAARGPTAFLLLAAAIILLGCGAPVMADVIGQDVVVTVTPIIPEPGTLLFVGVAGLALFIRRRERQRPTEI